MRLLSPWPRLMALSTMAVVATAALLPAAAVAQEPQVGGSIVAVIEGEPTSVDPAFDYDFVSGLATSSITEPLLKFCEGDTALCPNLATDWTVSEDGLTYTLTIREGVKFHDGTDMTVEDVVFSLDRVRDPELGSYVGWMLGNVADVTAPDDKTVVITMSQPDALLEYALASTAAHVVSKAVVEAAGEDYGTPGVGSIGTGPFKFVEWVTGDYQKLARNDDYWNKASGGPYLDEITIKILPEPTTRVAGLETGEIDFLVNNVPSDQYATVQSFDNVSLTFAPSFYGEWITFNTQAAALRQRQGPPGAQLRHRQGRPARALLAGHARHQGHPRVPHDVDLRAGGLAGRLGRAARPTTRTWRRPPSCSRSRASRTSSTA